MDLYLTLYKSNATRVELRGLGAFSAVDTFSYVNDAAVVCTLVDAAGADVSGEPWPLTLSYEDGSNGDYSGTIDEGLSVTAGDLLTAKITATSGSDQGYWEVPVEVLTRTHRSGYG